MVLGVSSCSSDDNDNGGAVDPALSYNYITRNRGYIGGSVIYNPTGTNNQLEPGTKLGIRLGFLQSDFATVTELNNIDFDSDSEININVSSTGGVSGYTNYNTVQRAVSTDIPSRARYGFLDIASVSAERIIFFSATIFSADGTSFKTVSKTLETGEGCDLNGDGFDDVKYVLPPIKRSGYEDARWLTFVCDEETGHTSMYITFTQKEKNAGYRRHG
ncbi:MAG: hypothetical protein IJS09_10120 [Treponema sp.]|nr:hypothetical protein [Treponema sp.]